MLEGVQKHATQRSAPGLGAHPCACLEGQIADVADEIAYYVHDLQDGLEAGLIRPAQLTDVALCSRVAQENGFDLSGTDNKLSRLSLARLLSDYLVQDVLTSSADGITTSGVQSADDVRRHPNLLVGYTTKTWNETRELRKFLYTNLYYHPDVSGANKRACDFMAAVFAAYISDPGQIGREATRRVPNCGLYRAAGDYIAGMTDRYLLLEHERLLGNA